MNLGPPVSRSTKSDRPGTLGRDVGHRNGSSLNSLRKDFIGFHCGVSFNFL